MGACIIRVGARDSLLSRKQVEEVQALLNCCFDVIFTKTTGDLDQTTSLRGLDRTDFFTRELDQMLQRGDVDVAIHSAKDLPSPLAEGLELIALTRGIDPRDSLVFRENVSLETLPVGACIATSSVRREEMVSRLRSDFRFVDIRGDIGKRLLQLEQGHVDGVVIAEAALIRLGLTHLNRFIFEGETCENQGRLAIVAQKRNQRMKEMFFPIDAR